MSEFILLLQKARTLSRQTIVEAKNYDDVVELSKDCPHLEFGTIEIREVEPT